MKRVFEHPYQISIYMILVPKWAGLVLGIFNGVGIDLFCAVVCGVVVDY